MFRGIQNKKIGNVLVYLADQINPLSLTKALKLLYMLDETSVQETGVPVTWLDYKVWELGPVATEIYYELRNNHKEFIHGEVISLDNYISIETDTTHQRSRITPLKPFDEDEFFI